LPDPGLLNIEPIKDPHQSKETHRDRMKACILDISYMYCYGYNILRAFIAPAFVDFHRRLSIRFMQPA